MKHERGNILFLILLAIVLFVALTYAVMSQREGSKNASSETVQAKAASILQFFDQIDAAVLRLRLTEGYKPENISFNFQTKTYGGGTYSNAFNANCIVDKCNLWSVNGGGVPMRNFEAYASAAPTGYNGSWTAPGWFDIAMMQFPYAGTDANDVVFILTAMDPAVCTEINRKLGITAAPVITGGFVGAGTTANWDNAAYTVNTNINQVLGKNTFATATVGSGAGQYCGLYHVVVIR